MACKREIKLSYGSLNNLKKDEDCVMDLERLLAPLVLGLLSLCRLHGKLDLRARLALIAHRLFNSPDFNPDVSR